MIWFSVLPAALVAFGLLFVPGLLVGVCLRLRGLALAAIAPALSVSLVSVAALGAPFVGLAWGWLPVIVLTIVAAACALAWSRWVGKSESEPRGERVSWWRSGASVVLAVGIPAILIGNVLLRSIGDPQYLSQRFDNFFHINAVQYVIDTANASPLWIGSMTSPGGLPFYPSGWHALVSLVVELSGASVMASTNVTILVGAAVVWPLGAVFLTRTLVGSGWLPIVVGGILSASLAAFPYLPLHYGVLYPLFLGLAVLPAALAVATRLLAPHRIARRHDSALLLLLAVPGLGVAHPGALLALVALTLPFVLGLISVRVARATDWRRRSFWLGCATVYLGLGVVLLQVVRPPASQIYWPTLGPLPFAIGEIVSAAVYLYPVAPVVAISALVGAYAALRSRSYPRLMMLAMAIVGSVLYVVVAGSTSETLRMWLTASWYNNAPRLASIWAIAVLPLAAFGAVTILAAVGRVLARSERLATVPRAVAVVAVILVMTPLSQGDAIRQSAADIEYTYELREGGPILTPDEYDLMLQLDDFVPKDAVIAADPWTGASFAYGVSGRRVLMPHLLMDETPDAHLINTRFDEEGLTPRMCSALQATGVQYILDFGGSEFQENDGDYTGIDELAQSDDVELIASRGEAHLYRIDECATP